MNPPNDLPLFAYLDAPIDADSGSMVASDATVILTIPDIADGDTAVTIPDDIDYDRPTNGGVAFNIDGEPTVHPETPVLATVSTGTENKAAVAIRVHIDLAAPSAAAMASDPPYDSLPASKASVIFTVAGDENDEGATPAPVDIQSDVSTACDVAHELDCKALPASEHSAIATLAAAATPGDIDIVLPTSSTYDSAPCHVCIRAIEDRPVTLAQALAEIRGGRALEANAMRHLTSDLTMVSKVTGKKLADLPCTPIELRPILQKVRHARYDMSLSRWRTIKSSVARLLKLVGWVDQEVGQDIALDAEWQSAIDCLREDGQKACFTAFARHCIATNIRPHDVTLASIEGYGAWRAERTIGLDVARVASIVRREWNYLQKHHSAWPQTNIPAPKDPRHTSLPADRFPTGFQEEVRNVTQNMAIIKPLDPRFTKKYSPFTIGCTRHSIYRAATIVAEARGGPTFIQSLRDVVTPAPFSIVMNSHFEGLGGGKEWAPSARTLAMTLKRVARICGTVDDDELAELAKLVALINPGTDGLSKQSRDRVAQFHDPAIMTALVKLPGKLFAEAEDYLTAGLLDRAARLHARALQIAILIFQPLRRYSLATLNIDRHFTRDKAGTITRLLIPASEVKNTKTIEGFIPKDLSEKIDDFIRLHRPIFLNGSSSSFLWPGGNEGHVAPNTLARNLKALIEAELGIDFNVHLIRHVVATMLLEDHHANMSLAQQLLGHRDPKTTGRIYGHARSHAAQQAWGDTLGKHVEAFERSGRRLPGAPKLRPKSPGSRGPHKEPSGTGKPRKGG